MRRLLAVCLCVGLLSTARAQTVVQFIAPNPISVVITLGQWISLDRKKVYYIEVESRARNFQQARDEGFRLAIEHAVGTLVLSETEARNSRLHRDDIITYASGYVDKFEVVSRNESADGVVLVMKVWVAHSAIANRLFGQSDTAGQFDGERTAAQVSSMSYERQSADRVLGAVLNDYPARAFDIRMDNTQIAYDANRQAQINVAFYLQWNRDYIASVAETVKAINQHPGCASKFLPCRANTVVKVVMPGIASDQTAGFNDDVTWRLIQKYTVLSRPTVLLKFLDRNQQVRFKQCYTAAELDHLQHSPWNYVEVGPGQIKFRGDAVKRFNMWVPIQGFSVENLGSIEVSIIKQENCNLP